MLAGCSTTPAPDPHTTPKTVIDPELKKSSVDPALEIIRQASEIARKYNKYDADNLENSYKSLLTVEFVTMPTQFFISEIERAKRENNQQPNPWAITDQPMYRTK